MTDILNNTHLHHSPMDICSINLHNKYNARKPRLFDKQNMDAKGF